MKSKLTDGDKEFIKQMVEKVINALRDVSNKLDGLRKYPNGPGPY